MSYRREPMSPFPESHDVSAEALDILQSLATRNSDGYEPLNPVAFRGHHLLLTEVLEHSSPGDTVLEGGVSSGYFAETMTAAGRVVDGHELDPVTAERARRVCRTVWVGDLQEFGDEVATSEYTILLFGDTLEHISDPVSVLRRLKPSLKPGGRLIISVPNIANWSIRLALLVGRFRYTDRGILDRTHVRFYTAVTIAEMLNDAGFEVERLQAAVPVPGIRTVRVCRWVHWLGNRLPGLFAYNFVVTARPST